MSPIIVLVDTIMLQRLFHFNANWNKRGNMVINYVNLYVDDQRTANVKKLTTTLPF